MRGWERVGAWAAGILIVAGVGLGTSDAQAARYENIEVIVTPSTANVTYGAPGSYTFYIANYTSGTINSIRFRAYLSAGQFAENNPISSGAAATCTRVNPTTIDCSVTSALGSFAFSTFDFAFTAPAAETGATTVQLDWDVRFGQGESTKYISTTTTPGLTPTYISLIQNSQVEAQAYIPPTGFNLYTGTAVPSATDSFTVGVVVDPAANKLVTAGILETACSQAATRKCTQLDVLRKEVQSDGKFVYYRAAYTGVTGTTDLDERLVMVLRFAPSITYGPLSQLSVFYTPDPTDDVPLPTPIQLMACPKREPGYVPPVGEPPCIASKIQFTRRTAPDPSLIDVVQVELWASRNGFFEGGW